MEVPVLEVTMHDGSRWTVPVEVIARDRAKHYAHEYDGDIEQALNDDTMPLFRHDDYEVEDWARNNMNWNDVKHLATRIADPPEPDYQEGWVNGTHRVRW